ncbi:GNAT family N-acetyltransferase [Aetokthonos hydrillicola Thurmond2011]|jgi:ribosomal-protein-alanine N-acetyltransferase|uniref:GNAT family N-acetyltransferase n=1 Tax=Aetokthonos hydrillicola Thurmond2011 TaxID=2712845 RepID=A0AAP5IEW6_9CYAN|nr:GNAT family N-acetyltransferase [Aetokthonos hydrillicola]MBO3459145.1 GNAT family N-acetyltransferase [Aetokthonos hydrillicola CCALA 1050]MBW4584104.1 GNAT family N-acetyltransferase [Aetokthonos hydrillicola CCALA 1050]MDR9898363.1 GNAT family N-acetyltransferase [Aetokthonos hydrillicola Thurmond2011]
MRIPLTYQIRTERCNLKCVDKRDIPYVFSATRFQGFNDGMPWEAPESIEELHESLQRSLQAWESGLGYTFTILCVNTGTFLGRISIRKHHAEEDVWNLGFWTHPEHQSKGYMTEAAQAILEFGFIVLEANRIEAHHALWNISSEKVLKRIGMKFVKYVPQGFQKRGEWVEANLLAIERKDWKVSKDD